jgi:hypothetical protein
MFGLVVIGFGAEAAIHTATVIGLARVVTAFGFPETGNPAKVAIVGEAATGNNQCN